MPVNPSPAVTRACDVLELLAERPERAWRLSEIARDLGMARATCQTVLLALCERDFVVRHQPDVSYTLGPACARVGDAADLAAPAQAAAADAITHIAATTGLPAAVVVRSRDEVRVVEAAPGAEPFGPVPAPGQSVTLVAPFGAVFAAWDDDHARTAWLDACVPALSRTERSRYTRALDAVKTRGYSVSVAPDSRPALLDAIAAFGAPAGTRAGRTRERAVHALAHTEYLPAALDAQRPYRVSQLSAPVFDHRGAVVLALMVLGPGYELTASEIHALGSLVLGAAHTLTSRLGGAPLNPSETT